MTKGKKTDPPVEEEADGETSGKSEDTHTVHLSTEEFEDFMEFVKFRRAKEERKAAEDKKAKDAAELKAMGVEEEEEEETSRESSPERKKKKKKGKGKKKVESSSSSDTESESESDSGKEYKLVNRPIIFNGENYPIWKRYIRGLLTPKGLWPFVTGESKCPKKDKKTIKKWENKDIAVSNTLLQTVDQKLQDLFLNHKTAADYWKMLQNTYEVGYESRSYHVLREWTNLRMRRGETLDDLLKRFNVALEQMGSLNKFPADDDKRQILLDSLLPKYKFAVQVITARPNCTLEFAINHLKTVEQMEKDEERSSNAYEAQEAEGEAYGFSGRRGGSHGGQRGRQGFPFRASTHVSRPFAHGTNDASTSNPSQQCYRCGSPNHIAPNCQFIESECHTCGRIGHLSNVCRSGVGSNDQRRGNSNFARGGQRGTNFRRGAGRPSGRFNGAMEGETEINYYSNFSFRMMTSSEKGTSDVAPDDWIIDSGATHHLCSNLKSFVSTRKLTIPRTIIVASGQSVQVDTVGIVQLKCPVTQKDGKLKTEFVRLNDVLYMPGGSSNLMSVPQIQKKGGRVTCYENGRIRMTNNDGRPICEGYVSDNFQSRLRCDGLDKPIQTESTATVHSAEKVGNLDLWHYRLCHTSESNLKRMVRSTAVRGLDCITGEELHYCDGCAKGKAQRKSHPSKHPDHRSTAPLELVHADLMGPITPATPYGYQYIFVIVDDYSRKSWTYLLKHKNDARYKFRDFVARAERETGLKVKAVRTDNGGEFQKEFKDYCTEMGIVQQFTGAYSPSSNGVVERKNRTLQEMSRSMMSGSKLPSNLWGEAVKTANYTCNRRLTSISGDLTPDELYYGRKPNVSHMRIWGCDATVYIEKKVKSRKFLERAWSGIFVGYAPSSYEYRIYNPATRQIVQSRNVKFQENVEELQKRTPYLANMDFEDDLEWEDTDSDKEAANDSDTDGPDSQGISEKDKAAQSNGQENLRFNDTSSVRSERSERSNGDPISREAKGKEPMSQPDMSAGNDGDQPQAATRTSSRATKGKAPERLTYAAKLKQDRHVSFENLTGYEDDLI